MIPLIDFILAGTTLSAARRLATEQALAVIPPAGSPKVPPDPPPAIDLAFIRIEINFHL